MSLAPEPPHCPLPPQDPSLGTMNPLPTPRQRTPKLPMNTQAHMFLPALVMEKVVNTYVVEFWASKDDVISPGETRLQIIPLLQTCKLLKRPIIKALYTTPHLHTAKQFKEFMEKPHAASYQHMKILTTSIEKRDEMTGGLGCDMLALVLNLRVKEYTIFWPKIGKETVEEREERAEREGRDWEFSPKMVVKKGHLLGIGIWYLFNIKHLLLGPTIKLHERDCKPLTSQLRQIDLPAYNNIWSILSGCNIAYPNMKLQVVRMPICRYEDDGTMSVVTPLLLKRILLDVIDQATVENPRIVVFGAPPQYPHLFCGYSGQVLRSHKFKLERGCKGKCDHKLDPTEELLYRVFLKPDEKEKEWRVEDDFALVRGALDGR